MNTADEIDAITQRASALIEIGRYPAARQLIRTALAASPENARLWLAEAVAAGLAEDGPGALEAARRASAALPEWAAARIELYWAHALSGQHKAALVQAREAVRLAPENASAHRAVSAALRQLRRYRQALQAAETAIRLKPEEPDGHLQAGLAHLYRREYRSAERSFGAGLHHRPDSSILLNYLAVALEGQGRKLEAADLYARALAADPTNTRPATNLAAVVPRTRVVPLWWGIGLLLVVGAALLAVPVVGVLLAVSVVLGGVGVLVWLNDRLVRRRLSDLALLYLERMDGPYRVQGGLRRVGPPWVGPHSTPRRGTVPFVLLIAWIQCYGCTVAGRGRLDPWWPVWSDQPWLDRPEPLLGYELLIVSAGVLLLRPRLPRVTLVVAQAATAVYFGYGFPQGPGFLAAIVAVFTAVLAGHRVFAWSVTATGFAGLAACWHFGFGVTPGRIVWVGGWTLACLGCAEAARVWAANCAGTVRGRVGEQRAYEEQ